MRLIPPQRYCRAAQEETMPERLRWTDRFDDPNLPGEMTVTVSLKKVSVGTPR